MGRSAINVIATPRDWEPLARKLRQGKPLERAALEAGIPIEEARSWAEDQLTNAGKSDLVSLAQTADDAMEAGLRVLKELANEGDLETRLDAAKSLVKLSLDAKKIVLGPSAGAGTAGRRGVTLTAQLDIFDGPGDWELTDPTKV